MDDVNGIDSTTPVAGVSNSGSGGKAVSAFLRVCVDGAEVMKRVTLLLYEEASESGRGKSKWNVLLVVQLVVVDRSEPRLVRGTDCSG